MKSTTKILIITTLLSANFYTLASEINANSVIKDENPITFRDDNNTEKTDCDPLENTGGVGCIDIR